MVLATILAPISELFDRWDAPGLSNDTEFAIFTLVLFLALVLLVSKLVALHRLIVSLAASRGAPAPNRERLQWSDSVLLSDFVPDTSPPLRI